MSYVIEKQLPPAGKVLSDLPVPEHLRHQVLQDQEELKAIIEGRDDRIFIVIGPCSAWPGESVIEYAEKLKKLADKHQDKYKIVLRTYLQKPRTRLGWLGPLTQPNPFEEADLEKGIYYCRMMMLEVLKMGLPMADEALFTHNDGYFADLLSWIAIGARSSEDQEHRICASMISHPVGIKHPTSGDLEKGVNAIVAAQNPHVFALHKQQIRTAGNPHAHLILRGGNGITNYQEAFIRESIERMEKHSIEHPTIMVDCSHENSIDPKTGKKEFQRQGDVLRETMQLLVEKPELRTYVKGFMLESYLMPGKQDLGKAASIKDLTPGCSITDGCLGWEETEDLLEELAGGL